MTARTKAFWIAYERSTCSEEVNYSSLI